MRETHKSESTEQNSTFTGNSISSCCIPLERDSGDSHDPLCRIGMANIPKLKVVYSGLFWMYGTLLT